MPTIEDTLRNVICFKIGMKIMEEARKRGLLNGVDSDIRLEIEEKFAEICYDVFDEYDK